MNSKIKNPVRFVINGNFLTESITGVQRYAYEIIAQLDKLVAGMNIEIAVPDIEYKNGLPQYSNIKLVKIGSTTGKKWEQYIYPKYLKKHSAKGINMCNSIPVIYANGIVCIHDICFKSHPEFFTSVGDRYEKIQRKFLYWWACRRADKVITVSEFSKKEILNNYKLKNKDISVVGNGWQHYDIENIDENIFIEHPYLKKGEYYFYLSSLAKNKNLQWILNNAKNNPKVTFVLSGRPLGDDNDINSFPNVKYVGYVTDEQARALMKNCKAFLFPSLYEGFGIPPMEALCMGAKIIVADTSCLREIYEDTAYYVDPYEYNVDFEKLLSTDRSDSKKILEKHSWEKSAKILKNIICEMEGMC